MKFFFSLIAFMFLAGSFALAQDWSTGVAPILFNKCAPCHHSGGAGHGDFTKYDTAVVYAGAINAYVSAGIMPPWPPDHYRTFAHERRLSSQEISTIQSWIMNGVPEGDTSLAPPVPSFSGGAMLTTPPDLVYQMPTYTVTQAGNGDVYWNFVIPTNTLQNQFVRGFEFLPGNTAIVHHALVYVDTGSTALTNDANYPGPGYPGFGGVNSNSAKLIGAFVPGSTPFLLPQGFGMRFPQNSVIIFAMHYPAAAVGMIDSSKIHLYLAGGNSREVFFAAALNHATTMTNGPLVIPANTTRTFHEAYTVPTNVSVFGVAPHMHLIGRSIKSFAVPAASTDTIPLINIPNWDFKWQGAYYFQKVQKIAAGTTLHATAFYDNTPSNPYNPNSPPLLVTLGENTGDEMMLVYFAYALYQPGDENIIIDSSMAPTVIPQLGYGDTEFFPVWPNPGKGIVWAKWFTQDAEEAVLRVRNLQGQILLTRNFPAMQGYRTEALDASSWSQGLYILELKTGGTTHVRKWLRE